MAFHGNGEQYYDVLVEHVGACAVTIPSLDEPGNAMEVLNYVSGILLTGSFSNIHPDNYGAPDQGEARFFDRARDKSSFAIINHALSSGIPILGICRGLQEFNVAMGGTLHQSLQKVPGRDNHRSDENLPLPEQFHPAHTITIEPDGVLKSIFDHNSAMVNSSHMQGVDRLADGLKIEATSDDGTIEAVSVEGSKNFALAVQFHPEWRTSSSPLYSAIFSAFADAISSYRSGLEKRRTASAL